MHSVVARDKVSPPSEEVIITAYASVVVLTAYLWDWLLSVTSEVRIVGRKTRLSLPLITYYLSRIPTLGYLICVSITNLGILPPVLPIEYAKLSFWWVASTANSFLFFIRVRAVFAHSRTIQALFCLLLLVIAISPTSQFYNTTIPCHYTSVNYCDTWSPLSLIPNAAVLLNDTLVCIFISKRVYGNATYTSRGTAFWERVKQLCNSAGLFRISRVLLRSGLLYYGLTIGFQIASTTHVFLGLPYAEFVGMIYVGLSSALACRVFRMVLLCEPDDDGMGVVTLALGGAAGGMTLASVQFARRSYEDGEDGYEEDDDGEMGMRPVRTVRRAG
ncbi:hypothetical protein FIBSPDRAFT_1048888 [Athelia psychrophila]|uniref:Uncharacterized protein n=1 Tax=Athelia psychrophila TaxID=1759441 RepID=A0A166D265_9AGAM|nr:hypothetical protein FIBSPDRAFT_1048888 [Fibularhizoctonia sp. CBS 109695]